MKPFLQPDGTISRDHHYLPFRSPDGTQDMVFAYPKTLPITACIESAQALCPTGWYFRDLNDPGYERVTADQARKWRDADLERRWQLSQSDHASAAAPSSHKARVALAVVPATVPLERVDAA